MSDKIKIYCPQCGEEYMFEGKHGWIGTKEKMICEKCRFQGYFVRKRPKLEQPQAEKIENEQLK